MARGKVYTTAPLLYNDQGDPIPQYLDVSDKTDSPQGSFKPLTNDPQDVRLIGSKTKKEVLLDRDIRTESSKFNMIRSPKDAIGVYFEHYVYGVTGTFDSGEGHRIWAIPITNSVGNPLFYVRSKYQSMDYSTLSTRANASFGIIFSRINVIDIASEEMHTHQFLMPFLGDRIRFDLDIEGDFSVGEGIDSEVNAYWIY